MGPGRRALGAGLAALGLFALDGGVGCGSGSGHTRRIVAVPEATPVGPGFASTLTLAVTSEQTADTLALLSVDQTTGGLGLVGGPLDLAAPIGDAETAAVSVDDALIFVGSDRDGVIGVADVAADGTLAPIATSPFALEAMEATVVLLNRDADVLYVGYRNQSTVSIFPVDFAAGTVGAAEPSFTIACTSVETMRRLDDLLFVACATTSNLVALRIETDGSLTDLGVNVRVDNRPDYLDFIVDGAMTTLYVSTTAGTIQAFDVDTATGALSALARSRFVVPFASVFELLRATDAGDFLAVGIERPPSVALFRVNADGSLALTDHVVMSEGTGGPEGIVWTPNGRFLFVANHIVNGIFVYERVGGVLQPAAVPRVVLPSGLPVDLVLSDLAVAP